ncbi:3-deoxy-7-phosphoheptulonate synthase [Streptomyces sp. NPDC020141]|uniref:3-deoxy-7-phosphoheptulonate synthase n=1 Tax=Streptomyces sp. NPDC020141 TaxID=3365065 RepID=UPI0037A5294A
MSRRPLAGPLDAPGEPADGMPLVLAAECDRLRERLAAVARGEALLLQGVDRAEPSAPVSAERVGGTVRTLLQMSAALAYGASLPVVRIGLISPGPGPGSGPGPGPGPAQPSDAVAALNLVRALTAGAGGPGLERIHAWNLDFVRTAPAGRRHEAAVREMDRALAFVRACGKDPDRLGGTEFHSSREARSLSYEKALTRTGPGGGGPYAASAQLLWIGGRGGRPDPGRIAFAEGIRNPVGVVLGPDATADEVLAYTDRLDPGREPGRLTFLVRMGAGRVRDRLPELVEKARASGARPVWVTDPGHGNTAATAAGRGTGRFDDLVDEVRGFFEVHRALGTHPGGVHVELGGEEPAGGDRARSGPGGPGRPRDETADGLPLDRSGALDLAFRVAEFARAPAPPRRADRQPVRAPSPASATSSSPGKRASRSSRRSDM